EIALGHLRPVDEHLEQALHAALAGRIEHPVAGGPRDTAQIFDDRRRIGGREEALLERLEVRLLAGARVARAEARDRDLDLRRSGFRCERLHVRIVVVHPRLARKIRRSGAWYGTVDDDPRLLRPALVVHDRGEDLAAVDDDLAMGALAKRAG